MPTKQNRFSPTHLHTFVEGRGDRERADRRDRAGRGRGYREREPGEPKRPGMVRPPRPPQIKKDAIKSALAKISHLHTPSLPTYQKSAPSGDKPRVEKFKKAALRDTEGKKLKTRSEVPSSKGTRRLVPFGGKTHQKHKASKDVTTQLRAVLSRPRQRSLKDRINSLLGKKKMPNVDQASFKQIVNRGPAAMRGLTVKPSKASKAKGGPVKGIGRSLGKSVKKRKQTTPHGAVYDPIEGGYVHPDDLNDSIPYLPQNLVDRLLGEGIDVNHLLHEAKKRKRGSGRHHKTRESKKEGTTDKSGKKKRKERRKVEAKAKTHKKAKTKSAGKFSNETTFGKCKGGAMISTKGMREKMAQDRFAVQRKDGKSTFPIRPDCRASIAGGLRAASFKKSKTHPGVPAAHGRAFRSKINRLGGVGGKIRMTAWSPGKRYKTAAPGKMDKVAVKRYADKHGISVQDAKRHFRDKMDKKISSFASRTGKSKRGAKKSMGKGRTLLRRDVTPHTHSSEHGKAGNREVKRFDKRDKVEREAPMSKRKAKRKAAGEAAGIKRSQEKIAKHRRAGEHLGKGRVGRQKFADAVSKLKKRKS